MDANLKKHIASLTLCCIYAAQEFCVVMELSSSSQNTIF